MGHKRRGIALILNVESFKYDSEISHTRFQSIIDVKLMEEAFKSLEFDVITEQNFTEKRLNEIIKCFSERDYTDEDCFICVIMSHGNADLIVTHDNKFFHLSDLFMPLERIKSLEGKPKIFFINASTDENRISSENLSYEKCPIVLKNNANNLIEIVSKKSLHLDCLRVYSIPFAKLSDYSFIETLSKTLECNGTNIPLQLLIGDVINTVSQTKFFRDGKDKSNSSETFFFLSC